MRSYERQLITAELRQREEEGCDIREISVRIKTALADKASNADLIALYDELMSLPIEASFPYNEPSLLDEIVAQRPKTKHKLACNHSDAVLYDRIYGAWLGRAAGCALGKPVEGWQKERIDNLLTQANALPLDDYLPFEPTLMAGIHKASTRGQIEFMDRDDDMDYMILALLALERAGSAFNSRGMANIWLQSMPYGTVYTAEDAAYRNFVLGILPPDSAIYRNPFREWIGAQIRADVFGYVAPGWPEKAAELAFRDAAISHDKNGIYGEMFVAAMIAAAFVHDSAEAIIEAGLGEIPENSRLSEAVRNTLVWCKEEPNWEATWEKIHLNLGHYHGVHTINNAALVVMGVWYGENDFEAGIVNTVRGGWDTDCTGATVGSILGAKMGAKLLPKKWVGVLNDRLLSAVTGHSDNQISDLAQRTFDVIKTLTKPEDVTARSNKIANTTSLGGVWELDTGWGMQRLDFTRGTIQFQNTHKGDGSPIELWSSEYNHPEVSFSFGVDKDGWDFGVDFSGTADENTLEGFYYPTETPVRGRRISDK